MPFSIYAHGVQFKKGKAGVTKSKLLANADNKMLGNEWEDSALTTALSKFTPLRGVTSITGTQAVKYASKIGLMEATRILGQQIQLLSMSSTAGGNVSLYTIKYNTPG